MPFSSLTQNEELVKTRESDSASLPNEYRLGDFVYCWWGSSLPNEQDFGFIAKRMNDYYVVELIPQKGKWATVPIENIRLAGRA